MGWLSNLFIKRRYVLGEFYKGGDGWLLDEYCVVEGILISKKTFTTQFGCVWYSYPRAKSIYPSEVLAEHFRKWEWSGSPVGKPWELGAPRPKRDSNEPS